MLDRIIITFIIAGGLGLLWFGWQYCKAKLIRTIPCTETPTGKPTLLYFTGDYCAVCEFQQSPIVKQIEARFGESIVVETFDVACYPDAAKHYKVLTLPTTVVLNSQGEVVHINYGLANKTKLTDQLLSVKPASERIGVVGELQHAS